MFSKTLLGLSSLLAVGTASVMPLELRQNDVCLPGQGVTTVYVTNDVLLYPVVINQYFESNTIINIGGITININNAPTSISTIFTATTTAATTVTATTTVEVTATATPFVLVTEPIGAVKKRQDGSSFVGAGGTTVGTCAAAVVFTIEFGQLKSGADFLSTDLSLSEQTFTLAPAIGPISTTFSIDAEGFLAWSNGNFTGGFALYSQIDGVNMLSFDGSYPTGSTGLNLGYLPAVECGLNTTSSSSAPASASPSSAAASSSGSAAASTAAASSSVSSNSSTIATSTSAPSATASAFSLSVAVPNASKNKRQTTTTYVGPGGVLTTDSSLSETFFLTLAQLFSPQGQISVNSSSTITPFAGSAYVGDITTSFENTGTLSFVNNTFTGGSATFCTEDDILYIVVSGKPSTCTTVELVSQAANPSPPFSITTSYASSSTAAASSSSFSFFSNTTTAAAATSALAAASSIAAAATSLV